MNNTVTIELNEEQALLVCAVLNRVLGSQHYDKDTELYVTSESLLLTMNESDHKALNEANNVIYNIITK